ncbi:MAG: hypothetical protein WD851_16225, partial [Pirellulales bacterium]
SSRKTGGLSRHVAKLIPACCRCFSAAAALRRRRPLKSPRFSLIPLRQAERAYYFADFQMFSGEPLTAFGKNPRISDSPIIWPLSVV